MSQQLISPPTTNTLTVDELKQKYASGQKKFEQICLRGVSLKGADLRYINLKGADLSQSDLSDAILYGANLEKANLNSIKLNRAQLEGAFLCQATVACGSLTDANLSDADLSDASLDAAILRRTILQGADLSGAYLIGTELQNAILTGAYFNHNTHFDPGFRPISYDMQLETKISVGELLKKFNYLTKFGSRYLGPIMTAKNWESSRPEFDWLNQLTIDSSGTVTFSGSQAKYISNLERHSAQKWMNYFINTCSQIIRDFPYVIDHKEIIFEPPLDSI